ncbi:MAG: glycosyltransferase family 1 protein [Ferruginibacter sp.]
MKKRILIDASTVTSELDGLSHYILNLIKYLPETSFEKFEYSVLINRGLQRGAFKDALSDPRLKVIESTIAPIGPKRDWDMFWFLRKYRNQFDIVHITSNNFPFALKNGICTIHDITFKKYFDNPKFTFNMAQFYMDRVIRNALRNARAVITVSRATKDDLVNTYRLGQQTSNRIHPVHHGGYEHLVHEVDADEKGCEQELLASRDYLLYVGTFRIHKNISRLLLSFQKAMENIPATKKLVIIGSERYLKQTDLDVIKAINTNGQHVFFTGYLSQACVEKYFQQADAFIFPSISEGFGLGVLEAFYYNIPLLCSNATSLPEIAGDAALYFDPYDENDIARAIVKFYSDDSLRIALVEKGKERLKAFSWKKNAAATVRLYEKIFDGDDK